MSWQSQARRDEPNGRRGTHKPSDASCRAAQNHRERTHISKDSGSFALFVSIGILCYVGLNDSGTKDATLFFPRGLLVGKNDNTLVVIKDVSARISLFLYLPHHSFCSLNRSSCPVAMANARGKTWTLNAGDLPTLVKMNLIGGTTILVGLNPRSLVGLHCIQLALHDTRLPVGCSCLFESGAGERMRCLVRIVRDPRQRECLQSKQKSARATIRFGSISWAGSRVSQIIGQTSASHGDSRKSQSLTGNAPDLWPRHYIEIHLAQHGVERRPSAFLWIGRQPGQRRRPRRRRRAVSGRHGRAQAQTCAAAPLPRAGRSLMAISIASIKRSATSWEIFGPSRSRTRESVIGDRMIQFVPLGNVLWFAPAPPARTGREIAAGLPALSF